MKTSLPLSASMKYACMALVAIFTTFISTSAQAQLNLLANPSFESPAVPISNGNNIMGIGVSWGGWFGSNGGLNIIRVTGAGYASGANHGSEGYQYVDVANSDGFISNTFVLVENSPIVFRGAFSNREAGWGSYVAWTGRIDILDQQGNVIATSTTYDFVTTVNQEDWYILSGSTSSLAPGTYTYRAYIGNSGHFDDAAVFAISATVLPIKLESFTAKAKEKNVQLDWIVSEEINVKQYEPQFSSDGKNFQTIAAVKAMNSRNYGYMHTGAVNGANYYRLKSLDYNGKTSYSAVQKINFSTNGVLNVFPNPASTTVNVAVAASMQRKAGILSVIAMNGHVMMEEKFTAMNQSASLDITKLTPGAYIVRVVAGGEISNKPMQVVR